MVPFLFENLFFSVCEMLRPRLLWVTTCCRRRQLPKEEVLPPTEMAVSLFCSLPVDQKALPWLHCQRTSFVKRLLLFQLSKSSWEPGSFHYTLCHLIPRLGSHFKDPYQAEDVAMNTYSPETKVSLGLVTHRAVCLDSSCHRCARGVSGLIALSDGYPKLNPQRRCSVEFEEYW